MVPTESLTDVVGCMGLNPIFLTFTFHPSDNLVAPVVLMIRTHTVCLGARPNFQSPIEKSDCFS